MEEVLLLSFANRAVYAALAVALLYGLARLWNRLSGNRFDEAYDRIVQDPVGAGIYLGLRFVAFAVVVGFCFS